MAGEFIAFGDAEAAAVEILRASPDVTAYAPGISTDLIGWRAPQRWVRVVRSGGNPLNWLALDGPRLTFDVFAEDKAVAHDMAQAARAAMFARIGNYTGNRLRLANVTDAAGLAWLHDPDEPLVARYVFALNLVTQTA